MHGIWKILERSKIKILKLSEENSIIGKLIELGARILDTFAEQVAEEELKVPISTQILVCQK